MSHNVPITAIIYNKRNVLVRRPLPSGCSRPSFSLLSPLRAARRARQRGSASIHTYLHTYFLRKPPPLCTAGATVKTCGWLLGCVCFPCPSASRGSGFLALEPVTFPDVETTTDSPGTPGSSSDRQGVRLTRVGRPARRRRRRPIPPAGTRFDASHRPPLPRHCIHPIQLATPARPPGPLLVPCNNLEGFLWWPHMVCLPSMCVLWHKSPYTYRRRGTRAPGNGIIPTATRRRQWQLVYDEGASSHNLRQARVMMILSPKGPGRRAGVPTTARVIHDLRNVCRSCAPKSPGPSPLRRDRRP